LLAGKGRDTYYITGGKEKVLTGHVRKKEKADGNWENDT